MRALFAASLLMAMALAGCMGGGGGSSSSSTTSSTTTTTGTSGHSVSIRESGFTPPALTVTRGTTVEWTNDGTTAHTVTSDDSTSFDSGNIQAGGTYTHRFDTVGTFPYHCKIHATMKGTVTVTT